MIEMMITMFGAASLALSIWFFSHARRRRNEVVLTRAQFKLYAARDKIIRVAADGKLDPVGEPFVLMLEWINHVIRMGKDVDLMFIAKVIQAAEREGARQRVEELKSTMSPEESELLDELSGQIGEAVMNTGCANSRILRVLVPLVTAARRSPQAPDSESTDFDRLTAHALAAAH